MPEQLIDGVAVIANNWWTAHQAREKLEIEWDTGEWASHSSAGYDAAARKLMAGGKPAETFASSGDIDGGLRLGGQGARCRIFLSLPRPCADGADELHRIVP